MMNHSVIHVGPDLQQAAAAVILIHGRGSSAHDIIALAQAVPGENIAWLAPSAPTGTWYPQRFLAPLEQNEPQLGQGLAMIEHLVQQVVAAGIPTQRIGLAGFSQGGCLVLEYALRHPRRYHFVAGLSAALIGPLTTPRSQVDLQATPVLLSCAESDAHIPFEFVEHSERILMTSNAAVTLQKHPGSAHAVFPQAIEWLAYVTGNKKF